MALRCLGEMREAGLPVRAAVYTADPIGAGGEGTYRRGMLEHASARFGVGISPDLPLTFVPVGGGRGGGRQARPQDAGGGGGQDGGAGLGGAVALLPRRLRGHHRGGLRLPGGPYPGRLQGGGLRALPLRQHRHAGAGVGAQAVAVARA